MFKHANVARARVHMAAEDSVTLQKFDKGFRFSCKFIYYCVTPFFVLHWEACG